MEDSSKVSVAVRVYGVIRERICSGQYLPGVHLVEADLAAEFHVSRITVRDALRRLVADDLVELLPHRGVRVRRLTSRDVAELYVAREPLEALAARLAAQVRGEAVADLRCICLEGAHAMSAGDSRRYMQLNARFHATLPEISANRTLIKLLRHLNAQTLSHQFFSRIDLNDMRQSQSGHEAILDAIEAGDAERAESAMRHHIKSSRASFGTDRSEIGTQDFSERLARIETGASVPSSSAL